MYLCVCIILPNVSCRLAMNKSGFVMTGSGIATG